MKAAANFIVKALASCFFLTYPLVRLAKKRGWRFTGSGFIGTLAGLLTVKILPNETFRCAMVLTGILFVSVAISDRAEELLGEKDDQRIVIDEWAGYLASVAWLAKTPQILFSGFLLFRIVDVLKPLGVNRFAKLPGGWGVVMDDFIGGLAVNAILRLLPLS